MDGAAAMTWARAGKLAQGLAARGLLLCFSVLLAFKIDKTIFCSWWVVFVPLWLFHAVIARYRFSLPAPLLHHGHQWTPWHSVVAMPLLISFEILVCIHLQNIDAKSEPATDLKIVFLPLLAFEVTVLFDNFRMCRSLIPADDDSMSSEAIWETLPHFWIAISMVFMVAATSLMLLKICGDVEGLGWWELFITFGIAECFAFLVCTKSFNPIMPTASLSNDASSSSSIIGYHSLNSGLVSSSMGSHSEARLCGLQDIGGHMVKVPIVIFQILLCMRLEGTPTVVQRIPVLVLFSLIFIVQGASIFFATWRLVEKLFLLLSSEPLPEGYAAVASRAYDLFESTHHGSRLLGWWSTDEGSKEEQARLYCAGSTRYDTFCGHPPSVVKQMTKKDLTREVWRLQSALREQTEISENSSQEYERLRYEKVLCRVCFEEEISFLLLPCRHRILCKPCAEKCSKCPICRVDIEQKMQLLDV